MRRLKRGGIALALLIGLAAPVLADDQDAPRSGGISSWLFGGLFSNKPAATDAKPIIPVEERPFTAAPAPAAAASAVFERESNAYLRRIIVCDRLEILADQAGDAEQVRRVQQLKERAFAIYQQRTATLSGGPRRSAVDEAALERNLGTRSRQPSLMSEAGLSGGTRAANLGENK
jgi:hypothetical protein